MELWERFSGHARRAVLLAHDEAVKAKMPKIGTVHLLLGLVRLDEGVALEVLRASGVDTDQLRADLREGVEVGAAQEATSDIVFTSGAQKALHFAFTEAKMLGQTYVGTEHMLIGLVREGRGAAFKALKERDVKLGKLRQAVAERPQSAPAAAVHAKAKDRSAQDAVRMNPEDLFREAYAIRAHADHLANRLAERSQQDVLARHQRLARVFLALFVIGIANHLIAVLFMTVPEQGAGGPFAHLLHVDVQTYNVAMLYFVGICKLATVALGMTALYHYLSVRALRREMGGPRRGGEAAKRQR